LCNQLHTCIETWGIHTHHTYVIDKYINKGKEKHLEREQEKKKERTKVQTKEEKSRNLGPKPITIA